MIRNLLLLLLVCYSSATHAQYLETFSTPNKGYLINLIDDFSGVQWNLSAWDQNAGLRDAADYFNTTATGVLEAIDLDQEICWESPVLNTLAAPMVSLKMDLSWAGFDTDVMANDCSHDYIRVFYTVDGGADVMIPNLAGGSACATVGYPFEDPGQSYNGSVSVNHTGIQSGSTMKIKVCVLTNANAEMVTIDNVAVIEAGVVLGNDNPFSGTDFKPLVYPNPSGGEAMMRLQLQDNQTIVLRIFDTAGRAVSTQEYLGLPGENNIPLHFNSLSSGVYWMDLQTENGKTQQRLILQR